MKIVADTTVLLRDVLQDDPRQAKLAARALRSAELIAVPISVLCEFSWVLRQGSRKTAEEVATAIRYLIDSESVVTNRPAVEAGLEFLDAGGDFADSAIAYEGHWLGAEEFVSFDKQTMAILRAKGKRQAAELRPALV